jgi:hypothetical protein
LYFIAEVKFFRGKIVVCLGFEDLGAIQVLGNQIKSPDPKNRNGQLLSLIMKLLQKITGTVNGFPSPELQ